MRFDITTDLPAVSCCIEIYNNMTTCACYEIDCDDLFWMVYTFNANKIKWLIDNRIHFLLSLSEGKNIINKGPFAKDKVHIVHYSEVKIFIVIPNPKHAIYYKLKWM